MRPLRLIFWETTRACNLECPHCRASAIKTRLPEELTTQEAKRFIDSAASFSKPILVFSGGEALLREDVFELIEYASGAGLKPTLASNASLITPDVAARLKQSGTRLIAVSLYGSNALAHDDFCGQSGAFEKSLQGIRNLKAAGLSLQINTTITRKNLGELEAIGKLALDIGALSYHIFFLVPVGRGLGMEGDEITPREYEDAFNRLYDFKSKFPIHIKPTCAPHYYRVARQREKKVGQFFLCHSRESGNPDDLDSPGKPGNDSVRMVADRLPADRSYHEMTKGCLAGQGVCFISYKGEVFGCGYLPVAAGDLRKEEFKAIWFESELFGILRDESKLKGRCGICEFKKVCSGCRARAYAVTGDYLEEEPYCVYQPMERKK